MVEVAEIFRLHGAQYRAKYRSRMLPSHRRAMRDIESCRTPSLGGEVYLCKKCDDYSGRRCEPAEEFIGRFLQHVLPKRFVKVRYYGLLAPRNRHQLDRVRELLGATVTERGRAVRDEKVKEGGEALRCPECGGELMLVRRLGRKGREPP